MCKCGLPIHKPGTGPDSAEKDKDGKPIPGTAKRAVLQYGFHSLRHSAVTLLREAGAPQAVVAALVGHNSKAMTNRYTHIGEGALVEWVGKMPMIASRAGLLTAPAAESATAAHAVDVAKLRDLVASMDGKSWKRLKVEVLKLLG